eukprot:gene436-6849_t
MLFNLIVYGAVSLISIAILAVLYKFYKRHKFISRMEELRKRKNLKVIPKTDFCLGTHISDPTEGFQNIINFNKYDESFVYMDGFLNDIIFINDEEAVKHITIQKKWKKTHTSNSIFQGLVGDGLVAIEGEIWKNHRSLIMPSFSQMNVKNMVSQIIEETNKKLDSFEKNNKNLIFEHFTENISQITLSVICAVGFGGDIDGIDEFAEDFVHLVDDYFLVMLGLVFIGKWFSKLPLPHNIKFNKTRAKLEKKVLEIIDKRKKENDLSGRDLLSLMICAQSEDGNNFSNQELFDESITFLFAGHDTTSAALSYLFFQLAKNPKIQTELFDDINECLKGEEPNYENIQNMKYLHNSVKEALRMAPPAAFVARECSQDEEILGYAIPKGASCFLNIAGLHYSKKYWKNPYEFNPKRWDSLDEKKMKFSYFPFSVGPRDCAGRNLALVEAYLIASIILKRYIVTFPENFNSDNVKFDSKFVLKLKNLSIQLKKRE